MVAFLASVLHIVGWKCAIMLGRILGSLEQHEALQREFWLNVILVSYDFTNIGIIVPL
jgi:hypothetical protein